MVKRILLLVAVAIILTAALSAYAQTMPTIPTTWEYNVVLVSQL
jgi:hypothetical protein